ncbi:hypothetical protein A2625_00615 [candidate division WOR-1 bacterium RIFCSPHIGHO2_01_FULL_53_15]|uniref:Uncharacterized protein n=1 Tax=candidate division WOR-1 bacterium RIFCSPHIGHO2_01_FULL_53_15 TaxID=1802564 RepID=A0A1F4Q3I1_UNCSA|nr:MAG: hypothetical protein A2625_00615 [candidate division WOR-1 bacterium RIFCSPHIGHO2_01_FULL_53_15]OGC12667.1 MAG: hypothetical protein A3D23_02880 [candidate division WOR-1 bacterium RIFCSPHIGHO2_02_FULL_53_26]
MSKPISDYEHIKRLLIIIVMVVAGFIAARTMFVPKDFGEYGHYRGGSLEENMSRPLNYAGSGACADCHENKHTLWSKSKHKTVNCQTCHGALLKHTEDPTSIKPRKPAGRDFCLLCHGKNVSKPTHFPQIDPGSHNPDLNCADCHNPHEPKPPAGDG